MYDPTVGRFLTEDPIGFEGDPSNPYRYVGNNPLNATDPTGLDLVIASTGFHTGIQVDVWDQNGTKIGVLTVDFQAKNWDQPGGSCGGVDAVLGTAKGQFLIGWHPIGKTPPPAGKHTISGTKAQDNAFLDWLLKQLGKDRKWLDAQNAAGTIWSARLDGRNEFYRYDVVSNNCNTFTAKAANVFGGNGTVPWPWMDFMTAQKLIEILNGTYEHPQSDGWLTP